MSYKYLSLSILFFLLSIEVPCQSFSLSKQIKSYDSYFSFYKMKYDSIIELYTSKGKDSLITKIQDIEIEVDKLKDHFRKKRVLDYKKIEKTTESQRTCTKFQCKKLCLYPPGYQYYTKPKWISTSKKGYLQFNPLRPCVKGKVITNNQKLRLKIKAKYKLRPEFITSRVNYESIALFRKIESSIK